MDGNSPPRPSPGNLSESSMMSPGDSIVQTPAQTPSQSSAVTPTTNTTTTTAGAIPNKAPRILACVLCQHRKIKCDRNSPCSNCIKANATCTPSTPAPARKRRRPNQDLQERLARCEELLKSYYASGPPKNTTTTRKPESNATELAPYPPISAEFTQTGRVVIEDGTTRFTDSVLWSQFYDELTAMRKIIENEESAGCEDNSMASDSTSPDELTELMVNDYSNMSLKDVQPEPVHMFRLWQVYLDRVNPLTKIIHVPSIQRYIVDAAGYSSTSLPANYQPLIFAIFKMAVYTLTDSECRQMISQSRNEALRKYSHGVRTALSNVNFMRTYDIPILQGLVIYTMSLAGQCDPHSQWVFGGVCLRIAQKMGLHRDGLVLGLTPFETEIRRRIWWWVVLHDAGYALMTGMSTNVVPSYWDTKLPSNVNDADLFPGSSDPIIVRDGPTEMGFALISYELGRFMIRSHGMAGFEAAIMGVDPHNGKVLNSIDQELVKKYRAWVQDFQKNITGLEKRYIDPSVGPMHEAASLLINFITHKLNEILLPPPNMSQKGDNFDFKENLFRLGTMNLESHLELYAVLERLNFLWFAKSHFSTDVMVMVAGQLMKRRDGPLVERAWLAINKTYHYHPELLDMNKKTNSQLGTFLLKGWSVREATLIASNRPSLPPDCIIELRFRLPSYFDSNSSNDSISEPPVPSSLSAPMSSMPNGMPRNPIPDNNSLPNPEMVPLGPNTLDPSIDQILGGYLDVAQFDWDMWNDGSNANMGSVNPAAMSTNPGRSPHISMMHDGVVSSMGNSFQTAIPGFGNIPVVHGMGMNGNINMSPSGRSQQGGGSPW